MIRPVEKQIREIPFTPAQHFALCHPEYQRGTVAIANRSSGLWNEQQLYIDQAQSVAANLGGLPDVYFSQQSFNMRRRITNLRELGGCYVDVDYHKCKAWEGKSPEIVAEQILIRVQDKGLPAPTVIFATGRGLLCCWMHDFVPRGALPRWNAIQERLCAALHGFGADRSALDCARVFRLTGTVNSKTQTQVYAVWQNHHMTRWDFEDLAAEVLPLTREELVSLRLARAAKKAEKRVNRAITPIHILNAATLWETVLTDLQKLRDYRWFGEPPPGHRDMWMFFAANAISWIAAHPAVLAREISELGKQCGWNEREARSNMGAIQRNCQAAFDGKTKSWNGTEVDPRYRVRANTIVERLEVSPEEMRGADLRVIIDANIRSERNAERQAKHRRSKGAADRKQRAQERLKLGREAIRAQELEGLTQRQLAKRFAVSQKLISKAMSEARKAKQNNVIPIRNGV